MFARLSIYENVDLELADQVTQWVEAAETDPFGDLPGYRGSMTLVDRDNAGSSASASTRAPARPRRPERS